MLFGMVLVFGLGSLVGFLVFGLCTLSFVCALGFYAPSGLLLKQTSNYKIQSTKTKDRFLRKYPSHARRFDHTPDSQNVRSRSHVGIILLCCGMNRVKRRANRLLKSVVDLLL